MYRGQQDACQLFVLEVVLFILLRGVSTTFKPPHFTWVESWKVICYALFVNVDIVLCMYVVCTCMYVCSNAIVYVFHPVRNQPCEATIFSHFRRREQNEQFMYACNRRERFFVRFDDPPRLHLFYTCLFQHIP